MQAVQRPLSGQKVFFYFLSFFLVVCLVNWIFITKALKTHSGVVYENAYEKGLAYNETLHQAEIQKKLNLLESMEYAAGKLTWTIKDNAGVPITGALVKAKVVRKVQSGYDYEINFKEEAKGVYIASLNTPLAGSWTIKAEAKWDNHNYQTVMDVITP